MASFNRVILMGNLTRDPEVRYTPGGTAVANFSLAINRPPRQGEADKGKQSEADFFDIVVFGKTAENVGEYLKKGRPVLVEGRLQQRRWEDKETGGKRSKVEVVGNIVQFLGARPSSEGGTTAAEESAPDFTDEDVPF